MPQLSQHILQIEKAGRPRWTQADPGPEHVFITAFCLLKNIIRSKINKIITKY